MAYALDLDSWRRDVMQAADNAGVYLFLFSPVVAAFCAWSVERAHTGLGELRSLRPVRDLLWRSVWLPTATLAAGLHLVVLVAMLLTAWSSSAVGHVTLLPVVVQFLSIFFFAALGACAAAAVPSRLTAPTVLVVLVLLNTLFAELGFRKIAEVGTGSGDFIDLRLRPGYLLLKAALFVGFVLFSLPLRAPAAPQRSTTRRRAGVAEAARIVLHGVLPAACVGLAVVTMTDNSSPEEWVPTAQVCHRLGGLSVCEPSELVGHAANLDGDVAAVDGLLQQIGGVHLPARVDYVSRGADELPQQAVSIPVTAQILPSRWDSARAVEFGFAYALGCSSTDDEGGPAEDVIEAHAVIDGWLQHQLGTVEPGSFPADRLGRLLAQNEARQRAVVRSLLNQVWRCTRTVRGLP